MKTIYALLIAALFTTAPACKKKDEAAKTDPAAKAGEPAKTDPANKAADPAATPDPAKTAEPAKTEPAAAGGGGGGMSVDEAGTKANAIVDKMVKAIADGGEDCAKIGSNLAAMQGDVKAMSEGSKEFDKDPAKKKAFDDKYGKGLESKMSPVVPKLQKCADNADVKAFFAALAG